MREINKIKIDLNNNLISRVTVTICGGETSGLHTPCIELNNEGEITSAYCDCQGFQRFEHCRHMDVCKEIKNMNQNLVRSLDSILNKK